MLLSFVIGAATIGATFLVYYGSGRITWSMLSIGLLAAVFGVYLREGPDSGQ